MYMYYESIRPDDSPYKLWNGAMGDFGEHRHADIEFTYCFSGQFRICIDKVEYLVREGELLLIPPMVLHGKITGREGEVHSLSAILGVSFLKNYYPNIKGLSFQGPVLQVKPHGQTAELHRLLCETGELCRTPTNTSDIRKTGNLYKIIACLIEQFSRSAEDGEKRYGEARRIESVERALELIYLRYNTPLSVDTVCEAAGYSKSNFCRIFKEIVGESFHKRLNRHRINCSLGLLRESSMQISDIALSVGFPEVKSFCRVFKEIIGQTPGDYRRMKN